MSHKSVSEKPERNFYYLLGNTVIATVTNMTVWFALVFFAYLETGAVLATSIISGLFLISIALTGVWFGSLVDHHKKKTVMLLSSFISLGIYIIGLIIYLLAGIESFQSLDSSVLWLFAILLLIGVIVGNIRTIALPTVVTILIPEDRRDRANGLVGTATGVAFLIVSVISGLLIGYSGMWLVLGLAIVMTVLAIIHLWLIPVPENEPENKTASGEEDSKKEIDIRGTIKAIRGVPGLFSLILFTTVNNFLGGVFMSLMDAYGLSLVSVQAWGLIWGALSTGFIVGGIVIAKRGLGKNPLSALSAANVTIWVVSSLFAIQPSIVLLAVGMYIYIAVVPFIEAAEHTIIQKVVSPERQGRVFGFAQSVEQAASPLTSFLIGPIAQYIFIPFMTTGAGVDLIGSWFGTGDDRGIALVFTLTGLIGLCFTLIARQASFYRNLTKQYLLEK